MPRAAVQVATHGLLLVLLSTPMERMAYGLDNGVARTPPMGWNSWGHFKSGVSAELLAEVAEAMISLGLRDAGYTYVNTDDGWLQTNRTAGGGLAPEPALFPHGEASIRNLTDFIHSRSLKFGIYNANSLTTCMKKAGGLYHERQDSATYASWGVDYVKYDLCGQGNLQPFVTFQVMRDALNATGRSMLYSCEPQQLRGDPIEWPPYISNMFRIAADMGPFYGLFPGDALLSNSWVHVAEQGGWTDAGYMEIGNDPTMVNASMSRTQFALWCIIKTNLLIAADVRKMNASDPYLRILLNKELIEISQDKLGFIGRLVATSPADGSIFTSHTPSPRPAAGALPERVHSNDTSEEGRISSSALQSARWSHGVSVTECTLKASDVLVDQEWSISASTGQIRAMGNVSSCLALLSGGRVLGMQPCKVSSGAQRWESSRNNESRVSLSELSRTIAPVVKTNSSTMVNGTIVPLCLATNGSDLFVEGCVYDPPGCNATRCANRMSDSPRYRQLWYHGVTKQLMSTYTGSNSDPHGNGAYTPLLAPPPATFNGPLDGLPLPSLTNRRCGDGHNGMRDQDSKMCKGATADGRLPINLTEITARCGADAHCAGFGEYSSSYFRPVFEILSVDESKNGWKLWQKRGYKPSPAPPPGPAPPPNPPSPSPDPLPPLPKPPPPLRNIPLCMATAANANPPEPPLPPPSAAQEVEQHQLQVWASIYSGQLFCLPSHLAWLEVSYALNQPTSI